jgi:acyl phosphate:glycerol-3-phosphate acyltransferase
VIDLTFKVVLSYLLGSLVGSLLVGRMRGGVDIRKLASGNAGATNALRTQGKGFALWVLLIDVAKGWLATRVVAQLSLSGAARAVGVAAGGADQAIAWAAPLCGIAVIVGHIYPLWYGFRGGKGVATLVGVVLGLDPSLLVPVLLTWLVTALLFGFVGLASMVASVSLPVAVAVTHVEPETPLLAFGVCAAALIAFTHRSNIVRMHAGTEPRARRLWLFGKQRL